MTNPHAADSAVGERLRRAREAAGYSLADVSARSRMPVRILEILESGHWAPLGAPVFVRGQAAFAEGVGERLTPLDLDEPWFLVAVPQVSVSTAEIFSAPELTRNTPIIKVCGLPEGGGHNDCQPVVEARYPEVRNALNLLNKFVHARMTGTGACVFGSFPNRSDADKVSRQLPVTLPSFTARGCNLSPLHRVLQGLTREARA